MSNIRIGSKDWYVMIAKPPKGYDITKEWAKAKPHTVSDDGWGYCPSVDSTVNYNDDDQCSGCLEYVEPKETE